MIRYLRAVLDRDYAIAALALVAAVFAYGYVQQADEAAALRAGTQQHASK